MFITKQYDLTRATMSTALGFVYNWSKELTPNKWTKEHVISDAIYLSVVVRVKLYLENYQSSRV